MTIQAHKHTLHTHTPFNLNLSVVSFMVVLQNCTTINFNTETNLCDVNVDGPNRQQTMAMKPAAIDEHRANDLRYCGKFSRIRNNIILINCQKLRSNAPQSCRRPKTNNFPVFSCLSEHVRLAVPDATVLSNTHGDDVSIMKISEFKTLSCQFNCL